MNLLKDEEISYTINKILEFNKNVERLIDYKTRAIILMIYRSHHNLKFENELSIRFRRERKRDGQLNSIYHHIYNMYIYIHI